MKSSNLYYVCQRCHRLVKRDHVCTVKRDVYNRRDQSNKRLRSTARWTKLSKLIKQRDGGVDQAAINGLLGKPYIDSRNLEVHHITPLSEDMSKAYDPNNLITLSSASHKLAESGELDADKLREIAIKNTRESNLF